MAEIDKSLPNVKQTINVPSPEEVEVDIQEQQQEQESPIDLSNIQIWDSKTKKGSRISMKIDEKTGKKERLNKKTGKVV